MTWSPCLMVIDHGTWVAAVAFSPDGTKVACGPSTDSTEGEIHLIDPSSGLVSLAIGGRRAIGSITFSPDGSQVISAEYTLQKESIGFWDVTTGRRTATYDRATAAAISANGKLLASRCGGTVRVWKVAGPAGEVPEAFKWEIEENATLDCLVFSPNSCHLATSSSAQISKPGSVPNLVRIWDAETGESLMTLEHEPDKVKDIAFSPDGQSLATGSEDSKIRIYELQTGTTTLVFSGHFRSINSLEFSPDGQEIVSASDDRYVMLWNATSGEIVAIFVGHTDRVTSVAFSADGGQIASGSIDHTVRIWDVAVGRSSMATDHSVSGPAQTTQEGFVTTLALSPDNIQVAYGRSVGGVGLQLATIGTQEVVSLPLSAGSVSFSPDNRWLASGGSDIKLWDRGSRSLAPPLKGPEQPIKALVFSPDSAYIASSTEKGTIHIWAVASRTLVARMKHRLALYDYGALSFSPDGGRLASGDHGLLVQIWDVASHVVSSPSPSSEYPPSTSVDLASELMQRPHPPSSLDADPVLIQHPQITLPRSHALNPDYTEFSSDGSHLASYASGYGYSGREVFLWDLERGTGERILNDPAIELSAVAVAFLPKDLIPPGETDNEALLNTPAVVTLSKSGQLLWQQGDQRRVWLLPSAISGDRNCEMAIKFLEARKIRCALAPKKGNVMVVDLQM